MVAERHDAAPEPPPPGVRAMAIVRWLILAFTVIGAVSAWYGFARAQLGTTAQAQGPKWQCPMHPQIVQDHPGECPICHMDLERVDSARTNAPAKTPENPPPPAKTLADVKEGKRIYVCPMHPHVQSDKPGECPICHMDLELLQPDGGTITPSTPSSVHAHAPAPAPSHANAPMPTDAGTKPNAGDTPPGTAPVQLSLDRIQSINVRTSLVEAKDIARTLRVTATVQPMEEGAAQVHVRAPGFVERVAVQQTGIAVGAGQLLFSMYSPEIFQAQSELVAASKWNEAQNGNAPPALAGARRKLELFGMSNAEIDRVVKTGEPVRAIGVFAPSGGVVMKRNVVLGMYVTPDLALYELQDLSRVYVVADVFAKDAELVKKGARARFVPARASAPVDGEIDLVYPLADPAARTTRARMTLKRGDLRPGDYGTVELSLDKARVLTVPRDAVIDTGENAYVFVVGQDGIFYPHVIERGGEDGERVIVRGGVAEGVRVVSGATFLVDSESRLQSAVKAAR